LGRHAPEVSCGYLAHAVVETARISVPTVLDSLRGKVSDERSTERLRSWARKILARADVTLKVRGLDNCDLRQSYVIMSNHQSLYDIPTLYQALPLEFRMVAKSGLFRVPIWGRAMLAAGFVKVDRSRGAEARTELKKRGAELQARGISLWIAPEGTRSPDEQLLPLKSGGFHVALALGFPILPVRIDGARLVHKKGSSQIFPGQRVRVTIHQPIEVNWAPDSATLDNTQVQFEVGLERLRAEVRRVLEQAEPAD